MKEEKTLRGKSHSLYPFLERIPARVCSRTPFVQLTARLSSDFFCCNAYLSVLLPLASVKNTVWTCPCLSHFSRGYSTFLTAVSVSTGVLKLYHRKSLFLRRYSACTMGGYCSFGVLGLHDQGSLFLQGYSTYMNCDNISARLTSVAILATDYISATTTYVVWPAEHLWNVSMLHRGRFSVFVNSVTELVWFPRWGIRRSECP